jgi:oxalate decarboxylase/phosphoglucose isomerase-like protein (cupin superfamily)
MMNVMKPLPKTSLFLLAILFVAISNGIAQQADSIKTTPQPLAISLDLNSPAYQEIVDGPPATIGMYSGLVTIKPGETVGHHNTENYEEMLVILSGEGEMVFEKGMPVTLKYGMVAYCPPHTEHDVKNIGTIPLKYIYVASKTIK